MDYKEKYEKALERLKQWDREHPNGYLISERDKFIFPELAESEDEKIRRWLVGYFETISHVMPLNSILSWLEKQKESEKAIIAIDKIDNYINTHVINAHDMDDSNPAKTYYRGVDDTLAKISAILQDVYSEKKSLEQKHDEICASIANELRPYIWSEEDNNALRYIHELISFGYSHKFTDAQTAHYMRQWVNEKCNQLKSLKPQKQDSNNISISPERLKELRDQSFEDGRKAGVVEGMKREKEENYGVATLDIYNTAFAKGKGEAKKDMWKPSEEQMEALERCVDYLEESDNEDYDIMESLLTDLRKLKEE